MSSLIIWVLFLQMSLFQKLAISLCRVCINPNEDGVGQKKPHNLSWLNAQRSKLYQKINVQAMSWIHAVLKNKTMCLSFYEKVLKLWGQILIFLPPRGVNLPKFYHVCAWGSWCTQETVHMNVRPSFTHTKSMRDATFTSQFPHEIFI